MSNVLRKIRRWLWTKMLDDGGYHRLRIYQTPLGVFWILRWGYWVAGFSQFFSMGKFYLRISKRTKI